MGEAEDVERSIGALAESSEPGEEKPEPKVPEGPGRNPNTAPAIQRPKGKKNVGIGAEPPIDLDDPNAPFPSSDAAENANDIKRRFDKWPGLGDIHGIDAHVIPLDGSSPRTLGAIPFTELINPDICAGEMLRRLVTDRIHRRYATTEKTYQVNFHWRKSGNWLNKGAKLFLGSPAEIDKFSGAGVGEAPRHDPYPQAPPRADYRAPAPPGYVPAAGAAAPSRDPQVDALMDRTARLEGTLTEVLTIFREERAERRAAAGLPPAPPPAAVATAAAPTAATGVGSVEEQVARGIVAAFKTLGVGGPVPPAPAPPNQPPPKDPLVADLEGIATSILKEAVGTVGKVIRDSVRTGIAGVGAPPPEPDAVEPPEPEPAEPIPPRPFHVTEVGSKWPDGRPVLYATDAEGNMDFKGIAFSNPIFLEQGLKSFDRLSEGFKDFLSRVTLPNGTQVVGKTPKGAVDGTPRPGAVPAQGVGEPPQSPNRPPPPDVPKRGFPGG